MIDFETCQLAPKLAQKTHSFDVVAHSSPFPGDTVHIDFQPLEVFDFICHPHAAPLP